MDERGALLSIFTITAGCHTVGVDSEEIERVASDAGALSAGRTPGRSYRLEELLSGRSPKRAGGTPENAHLSALVLKSDGGRGGLVTFDGVMDVMKIPMSFIMPVPDFVRRVQKPLFVWGFHASAEGLITLVTFHYLAQEGAV
ncbi:MAG: hypothetical protein JXD23_11950 [Spirochaetales bacterium]|nr:hypothetical protein [Spirochaetales bacterium]